MNGNSQIDQIDQSDLIRNKNREKKEQIKDERMLLKIHFLAFVYVQLKPTQVDFKMNPEN